METSLHRELKSVYAGARAQQEVRLGSFRIDVIDAGKLIEIQHASLSSIRAKIARLIASHKVLIVKPIVARKTLVKLDTEDGAIVDRRLSPKQGTLWDIFHELIYFRQIFPHPNLTLEVPLVEVEEWRFPGHGRRRRWRRNDFQVADEKLVTIHSTHTFQSSGDLLRMLPDALPKSFDTQELAEQASIPRWIAQRVTYCLRHMGALRQVSKRGNALLYQRAKRRTGTHTR